MSKAYQCDKCGIVVYAENTPKSAKCTVDNYPHRWKLIVDDEADRKRSENFNFIIRFLYDGVRNKSLSFTARALMALPFIAAGIFAMYIILKPVLEKPKNIYTEAAIAFKSKQMSPQVSWTQFGETQKISSYVSLNETQSFNQIRIAVILQNQKGTNQFGHLSTISLWAFDCDKGLIWGGFITKYFSGLNGTGGLIDTIDDSGGQQGFGGNMYRDELAGLICM